MHKRSLALLWPWHWFKFRRWRALKPYQLEDQEQIKLVNSVNDQHELAEERRLRYAAITSDIKRMIL